MLLKNFFPKLTGMSSIMIFDTDGNLTIAGSQETSIIYISRADDHFFVINNH